jgi:dethiobiotin synthetase
MGQGILITATDTGAGKTYVACLLGQRLRREKVAVLPLKPVESGCEPDAQGRPFPADAAALCDAITPGRAVTAVCLYPLFGVLSPHLAARLGGEAIDPAYILQTLNDATQAADIVLVEGAGGITVEMREGYSFADLARDASLPVLIVAENRLGVLNHLRLTIRCLQSEGIPLLGVILNDRSPEHFPARESNEAEVRRIAGEGYLGRVPYGAGDLPEELFSRFREALPRVCNFPL